jgi:hypothetical protein
MAERITGGMASRKDPDTIDRVQAVKTKGEAALRASQALAYAEERIMLGATDKAKTAMQLAGHYRGIAPLLPKTEGEEG